MGYAGALALNLGLGTLFCWSIYLVPLEQGLGVGRAMLSSVFSLSTIATVSAMSVAGPWVYATYGVSRVAAFAGAFAACGLWTASFAMQLRAVWPLYVGYGLMFGFASGLGYGLSVLVAPYAPLSAGLATGLVTSARAAGAFVFAPLVKAAVFSSGPQYALSMLGNYMAAATIPIFALFNVAKLTMPLAKKRDKTSVTLAEMERDTKLRPLTRVLWLCMATGLFSGLMVMSHGATLLSSRGVSAPQMLVIGGVSIVSAMTSAGRIFGGWICDRVAPKSVLVITPLLSVAPLIWASVDKSSILAGELALASAALVYGMFASTIPVEVRRVAGTDDFARIYGRIFTAWGLSGLAAPYVAGLFYDAYGDYSFALNLRRRLELHLRVHRRALGVTLRILSVATVTHDVFHPHFDSLFIRARAFTLSTLPRARRRVAETIIQSRRAILTRTRATDDMVRDETSERAEDPFDLLAPIAKPTVIDAEKVDDTARDSSSTFGTRATMTTPRATTETIETTTRGESATKDIVDALGTFSRACARWNRSRGRDSWRRRDGWRR